MAIKSRYGLKNGNGEVAKQLNKRAYFNLQEPEDNSNPATPTSEIGDFSNDFPVFLSNQSSVADKSGTAFFRRKPLKSRSGFPYHAARLFPSDYSITKQWYIVFYAWDLTKKKLVRKRVGKDLNDIKNIDQRRRAADRLVDEINYYLKRDYHFESNPKPEILKYNFHGYSLCDAIDYARVYKLEIEGIKQGTADEYISTLTTVKEFLEHAGMRANYKLRDVGNDFIHRYCDYLKQERKLSNKTFNNRITILHAAIEVLIKRDPKLFHGVNPFKSVKKLKTETRKHAAYTTDQMVKIKEAIEKDGKHHLLLFIQFMFYSLARPEELRNLKVGHIRLGERRILFLSETAKTSIEEYVGINDRFAKIIQDSGILNYPQDYYIFSYVDGSNQPGPERVSINYFYKRVQPYIVSLGFYKINKNYTLYSFKHTGAISLYMATKDIKLLQRQCRHTNIEQTNTYLRDLGLFSDFEPLKNWEGPI